MKSKFILTPGHYTVRSQGLMTMPVVPEIQARKLETRPNTAGSPAAHPEEAPNDTTPSWVHSPSVSLYTRGPPLSPWGAQLTWEGFSANQQECCKMMYDNFTKLVTNKMKSQYLKFIATYR